MANNSNNTSDPNHMFPEQEPKSTNTTNYTPRVMKQDGPEPVQPQQPYIDVELTQAPTTPNPYYGNQQQNGYYQNIENQLAQNPYFQVEQTPATPPVAKEGEPKPPGKFLIFSNLGDFLIKKWWLVLIFVILVSLVTVALYTFSLSQKTPVSSYTKVESRIEGPATSPSGSPNTWKVVVQNRESVSIQQIEVKLNFDKSFKFSKKINPDPADISGTLYKFASLQPVGQGASDTIISFEGILNGNIDESTVMSGEVSYTPTPLINKPNSRITIPINPQKTVITAPEIKAELVAAQSTVQSGSDVELTLKFENLSERELTNLRIKMSYPDKSFVYGSSELALSTISDTKTKPDDGNNIWYISSLPRLKSQTLKIKGVVNGAEGVKQTFIVDIGVKSGSDYNTLQSTSRDITITSQPLIISSTIANKDDTKLFAPGDDLNFEVVYQNKSNQTLSNLELFASIDDPADILDYNTLKYPDGILNNRVIQWKSSGVKQLENLPPQGKSTLRYNIKVKSGDQFIKSGLNQSAYTLKPNVEGKALNIPQIRVEGNTYKATGALASEQSVKQITGVSLPSSQRLYEVTWSLKTRQNKVDNVAISTSTNLPPSAWNQNTVAPSSMSNKISYNPLNGTILWKPGTIDSYTGVTNQVVTVTFQLLVDVSAGGNFTGLEIIKPVSVEGIDNLTTQRYTSNLQAYKIP
jgi:hypothetical protein